jgi:hypothetical protein
VQGVYVPEEIDVADAVPVTESKPKPIKKEAKVVKSIEVKDAPIEYRPNLASLLAENDLEYKTNLYWSNKGDIDIDLDQTWRDLPDGLQQRMEMHFDSFRKAIEK